MVLLISFARGYVRECVKVTTGRRANDLPPDTALSLQGVAIGLLFLSCDNEVIAAAQRVTSYKDLCMVTCYSV